MSLFLLSGVEPINRPTRFALGIGFGVFDKELRMVMRNPRKVFTRQLVNEVVQRSTQIVNDIAQHDRNLGRHIDLSANATRYRHLAINPHFSMIVLTEKLILMRLAKPVDKGFQFLKMSVGPVDPGVGPY